MSVDKVLDDEKSRRGFASMSSDRQREIASKGGRAAHLQGRAHEFTTDEARVAGRKGGETVSRNRAHMAAIGRAGGLARGRNRALAADRAAHECADTVPVAAGAE
jgi:general stress protein YciG